ncbi:lysophospholipid acyltransferase family protein [Corynebacterium lactis]|uniref:1-acyl-sn-glycerol-3-phosphate acyltransferase n=1 Tax=Corynebacterium lactis RW2-5 TaxID=1408189 RepID=A0A0K2H1R9_9CORY|nr:lysophospholipid acyltransferase family protein [Corynebacterium lactis]ALA67661.1 1-acyl-sn-glycerol-3-phosphate acyltransferase [Corynebacterium lactis RW2-5]
MNNRWYKFFKYILIGPWLRVYNRPFYIGGEKIPADGPALMVSNHLAVMDHFYFPLVCHRQLTFLAKAEYFNTPGFVGGIQKFFFTSVGQVPIDRASGDAARDALNAGVKVLGRGDLLGISLEGTRSPDGRLYRGKTGAARVALETGVPVYPMAMIDTEKANPIGSWIPRPARVGVVIGDPIDPAKYRDQYEDDYDAARALTDDLIVEIQKLSGQEYVNAYAADVKNSLAAGEGYPEGTEPGGALTTAAPTPKPTGRRLFKWGR